jgi:hypothetical protein
MRQMNRQSKCYRFHLYIGKVTYGPDSLSDADLAGREGRAYVMRVDYRVRVTYGAATPAVRARALKKNAVR